MRTATLLAVSALAVSAVTVLGCGAPPSAPAQLALAPAQDTGARALCTFDPQGTGAVHQLVDERRAMVEKLPKKLDAWILLGRAFVQLARNDADPGWYVHAKACADVGLELEPENALSLELHALALGNDHRFVEQRAMAERILRKDPDDLIALGTLADAHLELGDVDAAERAVQTMIDKKPNLPSYARAAHLQWLRGDVDASLATWRHAFDAGRAQRDAEPTAWVLTEAANVFFMKGDVEGARAGFELALTQKKDFAPAHIGLARCALADGTPGVATMHLEEALAQAPVVEAARLLADAKRMARDDDGARDAHAQALALAEKNDKRSYAVLLALGTPSSRPTAAELETAQALLDLESERADVLTEDARAVVAFARGDIESAKAHAARATRLGTPDPALWLHRGVIEGDREMVAKAMAMNPHMDAMHIDLARANGAL
jgi:tetratricopeptide (TPR) repeat protein